MRMLCWPALFPFSCSSLFPGGILKLFRETAALRISSLILACLENARNLFTSRSSKSFSVSLHLKLLIIIKYMTYYVTRQVVLFVLRFSIPAQDTSSTYTVSLNSFPLNHEPQTAYRKPRTTLFPCTLNRLPGVIAICRSG